MSNEQSRLKSFLGSPIAKLSVAFAFLFAGYAGIEQYITLYFSSVGHPEVGFRSLILIYGFFMLAGPLAMRTIIQVGLKRSMFIGPFFYCVFIILLLNPAPLITYVTAALLGVGAAFLWNSQNIYLLTASNSVERGKNSGTFQSIMTIGIVSGIFVVGQIIHRVSYPAAFIFGATLNLIGILIISRLPEIRKVSDKPTSFTLFISALKSPTAMRLSLIYAVTSGILGLTIGILPLSLTSAFRGNVSIVGILFSTFYIIEITTANYIGRLSDLYGRTRLIKIALLFATLGSALFYFLPNQFGFLVGVLLLALASTIFATSLTAYVGDLAPSGKLEFLTSLFFIARNSGTLVTLLISSLLSDSNVYLLSIFVLIITFLITLPTLNKSLEYTQKRLDFELNKM